MTHDPLCPPQAIRTADPCHYCDLIARVREDERGTLPPTERHREWWIAFGMGKLAGHKEGYAAALRDCIEAIGNTRMMNVQDGPIAIAAIEGLSHE